MSVHGTIRERIPGGCGRPAGRELARRTSRGRGIACAMVLGLAAAGARGGISTPLYLGNLVPVLDQYDQPMFGSTDPAAAAGRSRVEIRNATDGIIRPPTATGDAHSKNPLLTPDSVGGMGQNSAEQGYFAMLFPNRPATGTKIFGRVYNAPTVAEASFYSDSYIATAPATASTLVLVFRPALPLDSGDDDSDGLINSWEKALGTDGVATNDFDGDGLGDHDEMLAGTNPADPDSLLALRAVQRVDNAVRVRWQSVPDKTYRVEYLPAPPAEQNYVPLGDVVTAGTDEYELELLEAVPGEAPTCFFRVRMITGTGP